MAILEGGPSCAACQSEGFPIDLPVSLSRFFFGAGLHSGEPLEHKDHVFCGGPGADRLQHLGLHQSLPGGGLRGRMADGDGIKGRGHFSVFSVSWDEGVHFSAWNFDSPARKQINLQWVGTRRGGI